LVLVVEDEGDGDQLCTVQHDEDAEDRNVEAEYRSGRDRFRRVEKIGEAALTPLERRLFEHRRPENGDENAEDEPDEGYGPRDRRERAAKYRVARRADREDRGVETDERVPRPTGKEIADERDREARNGTAGDALEEPESEDRPEATDQGDRTAREAEDE
jgi:hypothetical protein